MVLRIKTNKLVLANDDELREHKTPLCTGVVNRKAGQSAQHVTGHIRFDSIQTGNFDYKLLGYR